MEVPRAFVPDSKTIEEKLKEMIKDPPKKEKEGPYFKKLDLLKKGGSREKKQAFLEAFVKHIPDLIGKVREQMEQNDIDRIYLDDPADYTNRDYGYRTRFEIRSKGKFYFLHYISGNGYQSNLDEDYYKDLGTIYDYLWTYPDKEKNHYSSLHGADFLDMSFKQGKEMYESMKLFLEENKNL